MCGIAGIISSGPSQVQHVRDMISCIAHRGPDGNATWQNENATAVLGHRRLAIIDLSDAADQPMHYLGRYTIVHNGEIYNYKELRAQLAAEGYTFRSHSDTEVILAAYDKWKSECLQHFDGMFAFAIWDEKERSLFAARDRFGEKPFYYFYDHNENAFCFASEIKALYKYPGLTRNINGNMLLQYLSSGISFVADPEQTFHTSIKKLPQRHYLKFSPFNDKEPLDIQPYYDLDKQNHISIHAGEAIEQFKQLFYDSVRTRLRSDVAIGTSLSGGIDSASIVAAIHQLKEINAPQKAFTASFPSFEKDETALAGKVASGFNLQHHLVAPSAENLVSDVEQFLSQHDEPVSSASVYAQYKVYQLAKAHGMKVILDGQGADEVLAGYSKYTKWFLQEQYLKNKTGFTKESTAFGEAFGFENKLAAKFPSWTAIGLEKRVFNQQRNHSALDKDFLHTHLDRKKIYKPVVRELNDILYFDVFGGNLETLLRNADRNAMAHGIEVRLPFLNHDVVQFIFSLPADFKMHDGYTKYVLRQAMDDMLPKDVAWKKEKIGFEPPQRQWMQHGQLQDKIHAAKQKLVQEKILQPGVLNRPVEPKDAHEADNFDWRYLSAASLF